MFTLQLLISLFMGAVYLVILIALVCGAILLWPVKAKKPTLSPAPSAPRFSYLGFVEHKAPPLARIKLERRRVEHAKHHHRNNGYGTLYRPPIVESGIELDPTPPPHTKSDEQRLHQYFPLAFVEPAGDETLTPRH